MFLLRNLILKPHPQGISAPLNHHTFLKHFIISINGARITHSIMSLATPPDRSSDTCLSSQESPVRAKAGSSGLV
nr:hypothetical protein [Tanacetum cinerariifolium]